MGHSLRHCEEQSDEAIHPTAKRKNGLLRFARNDGFGKKSGARGVGGRLEPRALWKEEVGSLLFSADVNAVTSDVE
jgi:hypothetical protein